MNMMNHAVIAGEVERHNVRNLGNREVLNMTIKTRYMSNGKLVHEYVPIQITMPGLVEQYRNIQKGSRILLEGRFETYKNKNGNNSASVTQVNSILPIDCGSMNRIMLWGRITRDPECFQTDGGHKIISFSVANTRSYKRNNEWVDVTSFIDVKVWDEAADNMDSFQKGKAVWVNGRLSSSSYQNKKGQKIYTVNVIADSVTDGGSGKWNVVETGNTDSQNRQPNSGTQTQESGKNSVNNAQRQNAVPKQTVSNPAMQSWNMKGNGNFPGSNMFMSGSFSQPSSKNMNSKEEKQETEMEDTGSGSVQKNETDFVPVPEYDLDDSFFAGLSVNEDPEESLSVDEYMSLYEEPYGSPDDMHNETLPAGEPVLEEEYTNQEKDQEDHVNELAAKMLAGLREDMEKGGDESNETSSYDGIPVFSDGDEFPFS